MSAPGLRDLPSVDSLLKHAAIASLLGEHPREEVLQCTRAVLDACRAEIRAGRFELREPETLALRIRQALYDRTRPTLRRVINATGIVLHTGLGRAPLADEAIEALTQVAAGYCNLEIDLATGQRGDRHDHLRGLLRELTGAEDGVVVNNNAAATFLTLHTLARGRGVIVSRGQLVEIGGSYRMPDIMAAAGCRMIEVGTTNRTHLRDYEKAIDEATAVLLRVHTSNYRIEGFTATPGLEELVALARSRAPDNRLAVVDDLGSGLLDTVDPSASLPLRDDPAIQAWDEPTVRESIRCGVDVTLFSGDKLLGGPQAGIIVGRSEIIERVRANPLMRTYRPDKLTLAALEATLRLYRDPDALAAKLPVLRMLLSAPQKLEAVARRLAADLQRHVPEASVDCRADRSYAGGGSLPTLAFDTWVVRLRHPRHAAEKLAAGLRAREVPVVCRLNEAAVVFDTRTLRDDDVEAIPPGLADALRELDATEPTMA
jgi:L-seryl-tRNA(Ser) seleniumtransferase